MHRKRRGSKQRDAAQSQNRGKSRHVPAEHLGHYVRGNQPVMGEHSLCYLRKAPEGVKLTERRVERWLPGPCIGGVCQARWETSRDPLHNTVLVQLRTLHY